MEERSIPVDEIMDADEVFCTGTAVGVAPVGTITYQNKRSHLHPPLFYLHVSCSYLHAFTNVYRKEFKTGIDTVCPVLYSTLMGIKTGMIEDKKGWVVEI